MAKDDAVRNVEWAVLTAQLPGRDAVSVGILLVDLASDKLYIKLLPELTGADEDVAEFWRELPNDLLERSKAVGGGQILYWLETTASHLIQLGPRDLAEVSNPEAKLDLLYDRHVIGSSNVGAPTAQVLRRSAGQ